MKRVKPVADLKRLTLNMPMELYKKVVEQAEKNQLNVTSEIIVLLNYGLEQKVAFDTLPLIFEMLSKEQNGTKNKRKKTI